MPIPLSKFREVVFQMLYSYDIGQASDQNMIELLTKELKVTKKVVREAQERVLLIRSHLKEIDTKIRKTSYSYEFERIQSVERNILRLSIFELLYDDSIPPKVAISEGLRLAKKFSTKESGNFVNAILDSIYKSILGEKSDSNQLLQSATQLQKSEEIAQDAAKNQKKSESDDIDL